MIGKIMPLVEEAGRASWIRAIVLQAVGLVLSAAVLGLVLGMLGVLVGLLVPITILTIAWGILAVVVGARDLNILSVALPSPTRQTPGAWKCVYGPEWSAFLWGLDLGQGWTVRIPFATYFAIVGWPLAAGNVSLSVAVLAAYGFGKAIPAINARLIGRLVGHNNVTAVCLAQRPLVASLVGSATMFSGAFVVAALAS
jgi:cytochrome c biogenesis protein CcdA